MPATAMDGSIEDNKGNKWNTIQTILHEWRLACLTMDLPKNNISSDDSESVDAAGPYRQSLERNTFRGRPGFRWLSDVCVPQ